MPVVKNQYPILEYDEEKVGVIKPNRAGRATLPAICVMTFFGEVLDKFIAENDGMEVNHYGSEMRAFPIYELEYMGIKICLVQAVVGSASIAMMTDFLIGYGVKAIITCGGCGVIHDIPAGDVIVPSGSSFFSITHIKIRLSKIGVNQFIFTAASNAAFIMFDSKFKQFIY